MITYLVGNPGSGKTYYAVFKIYQLFLFKPENSFLSKFIKPEKQKEYTYCYTNINEFKFDLCDKFIKFDFDKFYADMSILHALYISKVTDAELNERAKELNLSGVFIVLDEAHNFLKAKEDPVLVWWLTYHRHLYQDIYLITQDLSLISNEYKRIAEHFLKAVDSAKRLFKNKFRYILYGSYKMYQKDVMQKFHIPYLKEVFDFYHSGQSTSQKSFVRKFFYIALFVFILLCIYFYFFLKSLSSDVSDDQKPDLESPGAQLSSSNFQPRLAHQPRPDPQSQIQIPQTYIYYLSCIDDVCTFKNEKYPFPYGYISFTVSSHKPLYFYSTTKGKHLTEYFLVFDAPALEDLKNTSFLYQNPNKGVSYENTQTTNFSPNPFK